MITLLIFGFLIGMRHALEADHLAAVASLATERQSFRHTVRQGAVWGLGHTLTLFAFGSLVIVMNATVPDRLAHWLEMAVAVMLILLGADVLRRVVREKVHFHAHRHGDGQVHFHAHSHRGETHHDRSNHHHVHPKGFPLRALFVGLVHGMAGSAALVLLTLESIESPWMGVAYIALFGLGSMVGMAALSAVIAVPLRYSARSLTWLHNGLRATVGLATIVLGVATILTASFA